MDRLFYGISLREIKRGQKRADFHLGNFRDAGVTYSILAIYPLSCWLHEYDQLYFFRLHFAK